MRDSKLNNQAILRSCRATRLDKGHSKNVIVQNGSGIERHGQIHLFLHQRHGQDRNRGGPPQTRKTTIDFQLLRCFLHHDGRVDGRSSKPLPQGFSVVLCNFRVASLCLLANLLPKVVEVRAFFSQKNATSCVMRSVHFQHRMRIILASRPQARAAICWRSTWREREAKRVQNRMIRKCCD